MEGLSRVVTRDIDLQRRLPNIQTSLSRSSTVNYGNDTAATTPVTASPGMSEHQASPRDGKHAGHRRFVMTDPVALRYLEEDPSTTVLERNRKLEGYECYVVEQWACSRTHPTFVITTFTGDSSHTITVGVLSVPEDEDAWSPRLKVYFKALEKYHARQRETPLGMLMITNLSGFPSSLTVIPVPEGDVKKHREIFFVNEDLKRLGCSGRVGLTLAAPSSATQAKFHQLYRISDKIRLYSAVIELVKLCQVALMLFGKLEPEFADGLLCDITEKAINDWWIDFGADYYMIEPHDGILGPTTVAALLGLLMGARNRLNAFGAPVSKDVFDVESTKRGIAYFQRAQRIQKTRRLDRYTLEKLHRATAKAASGEGWAIGRGVKSTVAELSGKGGEMMMEMVGRDRAGIAEIETVDLEQFIQLAHGERAKWLWYGKPRKIGSGTESMFARLPGEQDVVFKENEEGGFSWSAGRRGSSVDAKTRKRDALGLTHSNSRHDGDVSTPAEERNNDELLKKSVLKRATDRMTDARSGLGRIKDAVGLGGHHHSKRSRDEVGGAALPDPLEDDSTPALRRMNSAPVVSPTRAEHKELSSIDTKGSARGRDTDDDEPTFSKVLTETPVQSQLNLLPDGNPLDQQDSTHAGLGAAIQQLDPIPTEDPSVSGSVDENHQIQTIGPLLRRTNSYNAFLNSTATPNSARWPRHLSFSIAEESILVWQDISWATVDIPVINAADPKKQLLKEFQIAEESRRIRSRIAQLSALEAVWTQDRIHDLGELDARADQDLQEMVSLYYPATDEFEELRHAAEDILQDEAAQLREAAKDVETMGAKLDYEIGSLQSKVEDVEDGVEDFERQVAAVEARVRELEMEVNKEGWVAWTLRLLTGFGSKASKERGKGPEKAKT